MILPAIPPAWVLQRGKSGGGEGRGKVCSTGPPAEGSPTSVNDAAPFTGSETQKMTLEIRVLVALAIVAAFLLITGTIDAFDLPCRRARRRRRRPKVSPPRHQTSPPEHPEPTPPPRISWRPKPLQEVRWPPAVRPLEIARQEGHRPGELEGERAKLVVRYADGGILKGYSHDFSPDRPRFHVVVAMGELTRRTVEVRVKHLKAVFFVRDFVGDPSYNERKEFLPGQVVSGRKVEMTFTDGEVLVGSTVGYEPRRPGFFFIPADPQSNNLRAFAVAAAVSKVRFL